MSESGDLVAEKTTQATAILNEFEVDAWLTFVRETSLTKDPLLDLIAGVELTWPSAFILTRSGAHIAIVGYYDAVNVRAPGAYSEVIGYHQTIANVLRQKLTELDPRRLAINYSETDVAADGLTVGMYRRLLRYLAGSALTERLESAESLSAALRGRKSPTEIARVQRAVEATEIIFDAVEEYVRPGLTQRQIAAFVQAQIEARGLGYAWDKGHNPIVTCGPHSPIGHAAPGDTPLEPGHLLHMDLGVRLDGYCSDLQRIWYILDKEESTAPPEVHNAFYAVYSALKAGEAALCPGAPGWQVDAAARQFLTAQGYPEYMHALGHLLGRAAHDGATVLGPRWEKYAGVCERLVEANNIFTLELHVVVPERGMVSLEEDVLVTPAGVRYLSRPQTSLRYIRAH